VPLTRVFRIPLLLALALCCANRAESQLVYPYYLNGSATQDNCNCYTLTRAENSQFGSVWNVNKIDLQESFEFNFSIYLGTKDNDGADGMAFVLQPINTQLGSVGGGMGYRNISPSVGVAVDTYQNIAIGENLNDPAFDHIAIHRNGDIDHSSTNNLAGPVTALAGSNNIEDGKWHLLNVKWDATTKRLSAAMDGIDRVSTVIDMVKDVFNNDPMVYWGFTASTGGSNNMQKFCTALDPGFKSLTNQETCFGKPVTFRDSSNTFGRIVKWHWDLGDGTKYDIPNPPPHLYKAPGVYEIKMTILGSNGCQSDTLKQNLTIGSDPFARIAWDPIPSCETRPLRLIDASSVQYGTVNRWSWTVSGQTFDVKAPTLPNGLPIGTHRATLQVRTVEGCISPVATADIQVLPKPAVDIVPSSANLCRDEQVRLDGVDRRPSVPPLRWIWTLPDGRIDSSSNSILRSFSDTGTRGFTLYARAANGCLSDTASETIRVFSTKAYAGKDTTAAMGIPFRLKGSGGYSYRWSPSAGLDDPTKAEPLATLSDDAEYVLTALSPAGCATTDTVRIRVFKGPEIYVPTIFTPNGDGLNDELKALPIGVNLINLRIFDAWGNLVFQTTNHQIGWDGRIRGKEPATGTFAFIASGKDSAGNLIVRKGTLQLLRR
jgi:gliding motility-associated-like protein